MARASGGANKILTVSGGGGGHKRKRSESFDNC